MPEKTCNNCLHNKVCNHDLFGFENCDSFISAEDVVEVVHSKWIKRNNERRCPICHYFYMTNGTTVYIYCPMCGNKMDGKGKDGYDGMECD